MLLKSSRFLAVLSFVLDRCRDPGSQVESSIYPEISNAIKHVTADTVIGWPYPAVVRLDVIGRRYSGQKEFACEIASCLASGDPKSLLDRVSQAADRAKIEEAIKPFFEKNLTEKFFLKAINNGLINRLTYRLKQKFPFEEECDIESTVGVCITNWVKKKTLDKVFAEGKQPSEAVMAVYIGRTMITEFKARGTNPLHREMRGSRTAAELRAGKSYAPPAAADTWTMTQSYDANDQVCGFDLVDLNAKAAGHDRNELDILDLGKDIIKTISPKGGIRRSDVLRAIMAGADKTAIQAEFKCSEVRASHLIREVRDILRQGEDLVKHARSILAMLNDEPWSDEDEITQELGLDKKQAGRALRFLLKRGLIKKSNDLRCYAPTKAGTVANEEDSL
jgi:hypothetical protein